MGWWWWWLSWLLTVMVSERCRVEFLLRRSSWDDSRDFQFTTRRQNRQNCHSGPGHPVLPAAWHQLLSSTTQRELDRSCCMAVWPVSPVEVDGSVTWLVVAAVVVVVGGELVTGAEMKPDRRRQDASVSVLIPSNDTSYCTEHDNNMVRTGWITKYLIKELKKQFLNCDSTD